LIKLEDKVIDQEISKLKSKKSKAIEGLQGYEYNPKGGWREWNEKFTGESDPAIAKQKIRAIQEAVFKKLGILGDPSATIDGKLGPFTLAAIATATGKVENVEVPMEKSNLKLAAAVERAKVEKQEQVEKEIKAKEKISEEARKRHETVEAAGKLDPKLQWYLTRSKESPTGYKLESWKPLAARAPYDVQRSNKAQMDSIEKPGDKVVLDIDGEKVDVTYVRAGIYKVEGSSKKMDMQAMYKKALEVANKKRADKKPKPQPQVGPEPKPAPLIPADLPKERREALSFLEWDPSKGAAKEPEAVAQNNEPPTVADQPPLSSNLWLLGGSPITPWGGTNWSTFARL
jgi:hypothetical protein